MKMTNTHNKISKLKMKPENTQIKSNSQYYYKITPFQPNLMKYLGIMSDEKDTCVSIFVIEY